MDWEYVVRERAIIIGLLAILINVCITVYNVILARRITRTGQLLLRLCETVDEYINTTVKK